MYKILLVEDEEIIRKGIRHSMPWEELGTIVVAEASNGIDGINKIKEFQPDIVITDINMPVMDGLKMLEMTRPEYDYVPIILTGYSEFEYAREAIKHGVADYVLKPLNSSEMEEAIKRAVLEYENIKLIRRNNEANNKWESIDLLKEDTDKNIETDVIVEGALAIIRSDYKSKLTMADFEEKLHYSERYIGIRFQKVMGTTVIEYLNRYRIQQAIALIKAGGISISDMGAACGIGEYKYFSQVFKKYIGCSPKEYKKQINNIAKV